MSRRKYNFPVLVSAEDGRLPQHMPGAQTAFVLKCPSEAYEASRLVDYLRFKDIPFTHVANETTSKQQGSRNKRAGVSKGFPDYVLVLPGRILFLELKKKRGGRISPEQKQWLERLNQVCPAAILASVAYGFEDAKKQIEELLP